MRPVTRWLFCALAAAMLAFAPTATAETAGPPADYTKTEGLSEPQFAQTIREEIYVPMADGKRLYVEVVRPKAAGRRPVILEASPYHGTLADRDGTRILPEPRDEDGQPIGLTGYFAPRGYAVVMVDLRGTGRSEGCLDHLGDADASDLKRIVEWAATRSWSNGRVGMTGHSYVGSTPSVAAAQRPKGLRTIVPSAGLASMYHHQFQAGVPFFLQYVGPMAAYEQLAIERKLPGGDDFGNNMEETGCGLPSSSLVAGEEQLSGAYSAWHAERDHEEGVATARMPIFLVHGVNDNAARITAADWFNTRHERGLGANDKAWIGQWDHGSGCCPTRRGIQWTYALHAWFDRWLAGRAVDTGPPVEVFMSDGSFAEARGGDRDEVFTSDSWGRDATSLRFWAAGGGALRDEAPSGENSASFAGDPRGATDPDATGGVEFATDTLEQDLVIVGEPHMRLVSSTTTPRVHLIANLFDESPEGERRRISQFAINPELRKGLATPEPAVPGERYELDPPGFTMGHHLRAGHRLVLRVTTSDPDKVPTFATDPQVTVFTGPAGTSVEVPVVEGAQLYPDTVPLSLGAPVEPGEAQASIEGSATPAAPGAGVRQEGLTSAFFEFDVEEGKDNATTEVFATPSAPADIDLYLQKQNADGSWSGDLSSGASGSLSEETMKVEGLQPGHYRVEVHNWAGPPANEVALQITFFNSAGEPGPGAGEPGPGAGG
ncbi:MAG: CocE/NonD family hydrolase [Thermoleophilaceae bacterium]